MGATQVSISVPSRVKQCASALFRRVKPVLKALGAVTMLAVGGGVGFAAGEILTAGNGGGWLFGLPLGLYYGAKAVIDMYAPKTPKGPEGALPQPEYHI